jgi:phage shock protein C
MKQKRLERDEEKAVVAGVVTGLAEYFEQDPVLFRVAAVAFLIITGIFPGLLVYLFAWIMIPKRKRMDTPLDVEYEVVE